MNARRTRLRWHFMVALAAVLGLACSSSPDTSAGADLFSRESLGEEQGCSACHSVSSRPSVGGPSLLGIGRRAGSRVDGVSAEEFIRESILAPTAQFADGWGEGMPTYAGILTPEEVEAIVHYLTSLR